ncbi:MAG: VanZ family protein, partial [Clostridiales bacterium]|nr:VanZ family protein [Clostridiales bacterium]
AESPMKILQSDNEMNIILTIWFTILNALFDEYHQMFVAGRDGSIVDVGVDCIGIIIVLLIIRIIFSISLKARGKKEVRYQV